MSQLAKQQRREGNRHSMTSTLIRPVGLSSEAWLLKVPDASRNRHLASDQDWQSQAPGGRGNMFPTQASRSASSSPFRSCISVRLTIGVLYASRALFWPT